MTLRRMKTAIDLEPTISSANKFLAMKLLQMDMEFIEILESIGTNFQFHMEKKKDLKLENCGQFQAMDNAKARYFSTGD